MGAGGNAAVHIASTPSDQLSLSGTAREALIGAATSAATAGISTGVGSALAACSKASVAQASHRIAGSRVLRIATQMAKNLGEAASSHPKETQASIAWVANVGGDVFNSGLRGAEIGGATILGATVRNTLPVLTRPQVVAVVAAARVAENVMSSQSPVEGVATAVTVAAISGLTRSYPVATATLTQCAKNYMSSQPVGKGVFNAAAVEAISGEVTTLANRGIDSNKEDKNKKDSDERLLVKATVARMVSGGVNRWLAHAASTQAPCVIDIQPTMDLLVKHQKAFGLDLEEMEKFAASLKRLKDGEYRVYHAAFSQCREGTDLSVYLFVQRKGGILLPQICNHASLVQKIPGFKGFPQLKSKL